MLAALGGRSMHDPASELLRIPLPRTWVNSASTKVGYTESLASRKEISMRQEQVAEVMNDPLSQELLHSAIPARIAYNGTDGFPRAIPIGFLWKDGRIVVCTASNAYKVKAFEAAVRSLYERMARISITPEWAKVLDFQTRLPSAVEQLMTERRGAAHE